MGRGETELLEAERALSTAKGVAPGRDKQCVGDLVQLHASWEGVEPGKGHDAKAADWKAKVDAEKE